MSEPSWGKEREAQRILLERFPSLQGAAARLVSHSVPDEEEEEEIGTNVWADEGRRFCFSSSSCLFHGRRRKTIGVFLLLLLLLLPLSPSSPTTTRQTDSSKRQEMLLPAAAAWLVGWHQREKSSPGAISSCSIRMEVSIKERESRERAREKRRGEIR